MHALLLGQRTKRLLAVAIIAQYGHLMWRHGLGMFAEPPFARLLFEVLFGRPKRLKQHLGWCNGCWGWVCEIRRSLRYYL